MVPCVYGKRDETGARQVDEEVIASASVMLTKTGSNSSGNGDGKKGR